MLEPSASPPVALAAEVAALHADAARLVAPHPVLGGWASAAAVDYEALAVRIALAVDRLRDDLADAVRALEPA